MAKNSQIGIIYNHDSNWIGGTYYIENLISSLNTLEQSSQPEITILSNREEDYIRIKDITFYPRLDYLSTNLPVSKKKQISNKISRSILGRNIFSKGIEDKVDIVFPNPFNTVFYNIKGRVWWLPDFQHYHLRHLFTEEELQKRDEWFENPSKTNAPLVLSSQAAKKDYERFFPNAKNPVFTLPFAVTLPALGGVSVFEETKKQFGIDRPFYLCSNQFWIHKNHRDCIKSS